jgi:DNA polymerase-3 subunit chi
MTEVLFYHLEHQPVEKVLPSLVERSLARGWRALIRTESDERAEALATLLWTYAEESFLPHGTRSDGNPAAHPVWLTSEAGNPNAADVYFALGGAPIDDAGSFVRVVVMFNGDDADAVATAREQWKWARAENHAISYWQQDEAGRWVNKAAG